MTFFNRKEEVLDIELTQYGKHLLSRGKWKPTYYAFFDDDVIYDVTWMSGSTAETQNDSEARIKEAVRPHIQHVFHSVDGETSLSPQARPDKHFVNSAPLGTAQIGNKQAPAWNVTFLKGFVSSSFLASTNSGRPMVNIPQINAEIKYQTAVGDQFNSPFADAAPAVPDTHEDENSPEKFWFEDGTFIQTESDFILLDVGELNGLTTNKDFEIEIFKIETEQNSGEEILLPLSFIDSGLSPAYEVTEDDLLIKRDSSNLIPYDVEVTKDNVSYFLGINTDAEIDDRILCALDPLAKKRGIFSAKFADCDAIEDRRREDIYGVEEQFEDPCEE